MQLIGSSNFVNIAAARIRNENIWVANGTMQYIYCQINVLYVNVDNCDVENMTPPKASETRNEN